MKIYKLLILAALPMMCLIANAQEKGPKKGDFTVAATVSYNSNVMQNAAAGNLTDYSIAAASTNFSDQKLSVGVEGGWFFSDLWKLNLGGGMNISKHPGYSGVPGTYDPYQDEIGDGSIPNYAAVADQNFIQFNVFTGVDRYFKTKTNGLMPYVGLRVGYAYGRNLSQTDDETYMGMSVGEAFNIRGAITGGVDYYFTDAFFIGAQVDPFAYTYNRTLIKPQEGLSNLDADSHNFTILAAPTIKIGFKF
ncbi:MAG TPA: hypothetical protein H9807_09530 [Candidatus Bacteroides merdavium]|uniref:Outer membrane protein beta-barrel domain-containing protein n=1 Tax=Candidatus Bacteroides merdavium TaxID=2838472 RepID=A0A9D2H0W5_9BACE|nr:hypothetical protein [Candidatus Bacteroides merdavium]